MGSRIFLAVAFVVGAVNLGSAMFERRDAAEFGGVHLTFVAVCAVVVQIIWAVLHAHRYERWFVLEVYAAAVGAIALLVALGGNFVAIVVATVLTVVPLVGWVILQIVGERGETQSCWIWDFEPDWRQDRMRTEHERARHLNVRRKAHWGRRKAAIVNAAARLRDRLPCRRKPGGPGAP